MKKLVWLIFLFTAYCQLTRAQDTVSFYFAAHEDDWQLFMNPNAYRDVHRPSTKVIFIYLTAGDAGAGLGNAGRSQPYYLARESGAKLSAKFLADAANDTPVIALNGVGAYAGHPISKWIYGNTISYFLRLPDGNPQGTGYSTTGFQSLKRLRDKAISGITAIDSSTTYRNWDDLTATVRAIIDHERGKASSVWVNLPDTDTAKNKGDHQDHQHVARGVLEAINDLFCINKLFYLNYVTAELPENMNASDREIEAATFGSLVAGVTAYDHISPFDRLHRSWLSRHYFRVERGKEKCK
jgi:hypothetical protein